MKRLEVGSSKSKRPFRIKERVDHLSYEIVLLETVRNFKFCDKNRIGDNLSFVGFAVPSVVRHYRTGSAVLRISSCSSTISRVIRSFSILVFP